MMKTQLVLPHINLRTPYKLALGSATLVVLVWAVRYLYLPVVGRIGAQRVQLNDLAVKVADAKVLAVIMAAVYARDLRPSAPSHTPAVDPSAAVPAPASRPAASPADKVNLDLPAENGSREAQRKHAAALAWGRDPFTGSSAGGEVSGFDLSGILWDANAPIAVINGQMLRVGDEVEGYRIVTITQDRVTMSDGSQPLNLTIPS